LDLPREPFYDCLLLTYFAYGHKRGWATPQTSDH